MRLNLFRQAPIDRTGPLNWLKHDTRINPAKVHSSEPDLSLVKASGCIRVYLFSDQGPAVDIPSRHADVPGTG